VKGAARYPARPAIPPHDPGRRSQARTTWHCAVRRERPVSEDAGGASLRYGNPWADPPEVRDPLRRLRGHLVMPVTVWLAGAGDDKWDENDEGETDAVGETGAVGESGPRALEPAAVEPAVAGRAEEPGTDKADGAVAVGLTVSSTFLSQGEPAMLAGLVSTASELGDILAESPSSRFVVHVLGAAHRRLAQHFAGELPAPAELLVTAPSAHGPVLEAVPDRIYCRLTTRRPFGWSLLVEAEVERTEVGEAGKGLAWYHGAFHVLER
jgi:3-hydroxy-9,10-secoandrosta-1,3,5(10)-triene-9,17-dione monooxygenase reductase component